MSPTRFIISETLDSLPNSQ
uniref:Uncharacterized protein n=1 Tax=Heterorhabditis bacteriophora TaxID=37862 RepID=A0A1I7WKG0_HETBA